jgi:hypothetical protein
MPTLREAAVPKQGRLKRASVQVKDDQYAWLARRSLELGVDSIAAVVRMLIEQAMNADTPTARRAP